MVIRSPLRPTRIVPPRLPAAGAADWAGADVGAAAAAGAAWAAVAAGGAVVGAAWAAAAGLVVSGAAGGFAAALCAPGASAGLAVGAGVGGAVVPQAARRAVVAARPRLSTRRRENRLRSMTLGSSFFQGQVTTR